MAKPRSYFREWRIHRHLTQSDVIGRLIEMSDPHLPVTEASLSRIEAGKQNYKSNLLHALADIYQCEVWELLGRNPARAGELVDLVQRLEPAQHPAAAAMIEGLIVAQGRQDFTPAPPPEEPLRRKRR